MTASRRHLLLATAGLLGSIPLLRPAATLQAGPAATTALITIDNFTFAPAKLYTATCAVVTWTNQDDIPHTIVMPDPAQPVKSPVLDTYEHFSFTFTKPGTFPYFCSLHPHMQGTVIVI